MIRTRIAGTGRALPERVMTNDDLSKIVETSDEWIRERTGIAARRILEDGRVTSDLAADAAKRACQRAGIKPSELDLIICGTVTPDMPLPALAVFVQQKIGATCAAFDIAAACAGFLYGMAIGDSMVRGGGYKRVLVIGVEVLSRFVDWTDRNTCVLFGDGAGAAVLVPASESDGDRGIWSTHLFADGAQARALAMPAGGTETPLTAENVARREHLVKMTGKTIFAHAVKNLSAAGQIALDYNKLTASDIDCVVAHQANLRILDVVAERSNIPLSKFYLNIQNYGNTSSASIPIALDEAIEKGVVKEGSMILMTALGAGLAWGSAVIKL